MHKTKLVIVIFIVTCFCMVNVATAEEWVEVPVTLPDNALVYFDLDSIKYSGDILENGGFSTYYLVAIKGVTPAKSASPETTVKFWWLFDTSDWTCRYIDENGKKDKNWSRVRNGKGPDYVLKYIIDYTWNYKVRHGRCTDGCVRPTNLNELAK